MRLQHMFQDGLSLQAYVYVLAGRNDAATGSCQLVPFLCYLYIFICLFEKGECFQRILKYSEVAGG